MKYTRVNQACAWMSKTTLVKVKAKCCVVITSYSSVMIVLQIQARYYVSYYYC